jgi:tripartite-type tricarboxylate transporter receptor subunit TctC
MGPRALLQRQITKTVALPEIKERLVAMGFDPAQGAPEQFSSYLAAEYATSKVVREANVKID